MIADDENGAPAAPEVDAETLAVEDPQPAAETEEGEEPESKKEDPRDRTLKKMQRRIDRITREKLELRAEIERSKAGDQPIQLHREQFASEEDYIEALVQQRLSAEKSQEQRKSYAQRVDSILKEAEKLGDFDRDEFAEISITPDMADAIVESDISAKLVKYLHDDPDEAERISKLSPARQAAEIGKLEDRLSSEEKPRAAKSSAPEPIKPVAGSGKSSTGYRPDMSMAEYAKWRKAQR